MREWRTDQSRWKDMRTNWSRVRGVVKSRDRRACQVCGKTKTQAKLHVDHIVPFLLSQSNDIENLILICQRCHSQKTDIENQLLLGRIGCFLVSLSKAGWPMARVRVAMKLYGLPLRVRYRPVPWGFTSTRWVVARGKPCHMKALDRWLRES